MGAAGANEDKGNRKLVQVYVQEILPRKMEYNLEYLRQFTFRTDIRLLFQTAFHVAGFSGKGDKQTQA